MNWYGSFQIYAWMVVGPFSEFDLRACVTRVKRKSMFDMHAHVKSVRNNGTCDGLKLFEKYHAWNLDFISPRSVKERPEIKMKEPNQQT